MTTKKFLVDDYLELRTLHRVFREAKFCRQADDLEISSSPVVANLFTRLMDTLIQKQVWLEGESARTKWAKWLTMEDATRDEWIAARSRAQANNHWTKWTIEEKKEHTEVLFAPFILEEKYLLQFIAEVNFKFQ